MPSLIEEHKCVFLRIFTELKPSFHKDYNGPPIRNLDCSREMIIIERIGDFPVILILPKMRGCVGKFYQVTSLIGRVAMSKVRADINVMFDG